MKPRKIYYRRKNKGIIIEGKIGKKSVYIWTIPGPLKLLQLLQAKKSFFPKEKWTKINEKIKRLDKRP